MYVEKRQKSRRDMMEYCGEGVGSLSEGVPPSAPREVDFFLFFSPSRN